jgi:hypothetical protein
LCRAYLRSNRILTSVSSVSEELLSEVWQKLLGTVFLGDDEPHGVSYTSLPTEWNVISHLPEQDGRVVWLINEIGGSEAIGQRFEDIQRQRYGRALSGGGCRIAQPANDNAFEFDQELEDDRSLREVDSRLLWSGLLVIAARQFGEGEDAVKLLQLLAKFPDLFDDSSGSQWPIRRIVNLLNTNFSPPEWRDRRVEDARKRLTDWISRLARRNGFDLTDLETFFARVGRQQELEKQAIQPKLHTSNLYN